MDNRMQLIQNVFLSLDTLQNIMRSHFILLGLSPRLPHFYFRCTGPKDDAPLLRFRRSLSFGNLLPFRYSQRQTRFLAIQTNKLVQDSPKQFDRLRAAARSRAKERIEKDSRNKTHCAVLLGNLKLKMILQKKKCKFCRRARLDMML